MKNEVTLKANAMGLLLSCPFIKRLENCPLKITDGFTMLEKHKWILEQDSCYLQQIYQQHEKCFYNRR